jgi:cytochrome oxidase assembly protein ShyY1
MADEPGSLAVATPSRPEPAIPNTTSKTLLRPKWVAGHVLALVLTVAFITAGFWQIARNHQANDKLAREEAEFAAAAPDITKVSDRAAVNTDSTTIQGTRVSATGTYDTAHQVLLRGVSRDNTPGYDVLTPLRLANGDAVLVDRGWVRLGRVTNGLGTAGAPTGLVTVRGTLQPTSTMRATEQVKTEGGVPSLPRPDSAQVARVAGYPLRTAYITAQYQQPSGDAGAPALPEPRKTSQVNHISYAIQWFSFAAIAVIGWPIVLRRATRRQRPRRRPA